MKVLIDEDVCVGCGMCEEICPEIFKLQDEVATIKLDKDKAVPEDLEASCTEAAESCPVEAIITEE